MKNSLAKGSRVMALFMRADPYPVARLVERSGLYRASPEELERRREVSIREQEPLIIGEGVSIYARSIRRLGKWLYCMARDASTKYFCAIGHGDSPYEEYATRKDVEMAGEDRRAKLLILPLIPPTAKILQTLFPFTAPISLRDRRATIGMGDRIGLATAGHVRVARRFGVAPVLAQQSMRELEFTGRSFTEVVADCAFLVFQEGYEEGYGADGDHLKHLVSIDKALDEGMRMITLDLTDVLRPAAAHFSPERVEAEFDTLPSAFRSKIERDYFDREFSVGGMSIYLSQLDARRCALLYHDALVSAEQVDSHLRKHRNVACDLEISIDETTTPTSPEHHLFIARELQLRGIEVISLAPRFVGDFQKAIDYIGDRVEFDRHLAIHCSIAKSFGDYKISIHSGSDKLAIYPSIGMRTGGRFHLKTSGTSWLEALRVVAGVNPNLFRSMMEGAQYHYPEALKQYHISADINTIPDPERMEESQLPTLLDHPACRQFLHISYGGLLNDAEISESLFDTLHTHEEEYNDALERHFERHLRLLNSAPNTTS